MKDKVRIRVTYMVTDKVRVRLLDSARVKVRERGLELCLETELKLG